MKRFQRFMITVLSFTTGLLGVVHLIKVNTPQKAPLSIVKMFSASLSTFISIGGNILFFLALTQRKFISALAALTGWQLSNRYLARAIRRHRGFERAFGSEWQSKISPERLAKMLPVRYQPVVPQPPMARLTRDVAYWTIPDSERQLLCDLWQPPAEVPASGLGVIYLHGSSWHFLDKDFGTRFFFRHLAAQGHVVMDVAYRLCPETDVIGMVGDVFRAIAWFKQHGAAYGVNPERIVLCGGSAGGHLALLAAYGRGKPELLPPDVAGSDLAVRGVISYYGPGDLRAYYYQAGRVLGFEDRQPMSAGKGKSLIDLLTIPIVEKILGQPFAQKTEWSNLSHLAMMRNLLGGTPTEKPAMYDLASPITHVGAHCPPTLLLQGEHDYCVPVESSRALARELQANKVPVVYVEFPQTEHAFDLILLPRLSPPAQAALFDVDRFLGWMLSE